MKNLFKSIIILIMIFCLDTFVLGRNIYNVSEYDIKAAFVYNFLKFIKLKNEVHKNFIILCVYCPEDIRSSFKKLDGKKIESKIIKVEFYKNINNNIPNCDVLFLHHDILNNKQLDFLKKNNKNILSISDQKDFIKHGGIIELFTQNNKIRFKINLISAKKAKIKISSRLLELAKEIIK